MTTPISNEEIPDDECVANIPIINGEELNKVIDIKPLSYLEKLAKSIKLITPIPIVEINPRKLKD